ncbi:MAG: CotS family spore coat protein [Peptococcaceae bacterium]|nr:CotS family spore coat protein [Peptococcaceae bacterium]
MPTVDWLRENIPHWYGLKVQTAQKVRDAWRLETTLGPKCFKRVELSRGKVDFIAAALNHLLHNGFTATIPFIATLDGCNFVEEPDGLYYLTDWIPGREGDITGVADVCAAAGILAKLHQASQGFILPPNCEPRQTWGKLPYEWLKHHAELERYRVLAQAAMDSTFNREFAATSGWYIARCQCAIDILHTCNYEKLVEQAKRQGSLCHRDFTYHNFIFDTANRLYVIDFDYCAQEIRAYDVARYARKVARNFKWQLRPVKLMLQAYDEVAPLSSDEIRFIAAFLFFPQQYWRIANRHFNTSSHAKAKLTKELLHETKHRLQEERFLQQFWAASTCGAVVRSGI